jgi:hypothetical protein
MLDVDSDDAALLHETVDEFLFAAQYVTDYAFQGEYVITSKAQLQDETYDNVRDRTPLNAGLVQKPGTRPPTPARAPLLAGNRARRRRSHASPARTSSTTIGLRRSTTTL